MLEQFCLFPERGDQGWPSLHATQCAACMGTELGEVLRAKVRQLVLLPVTPDVFDGVEFRGIGRQELELDVAVLTIDVLFDESAAMRRQTVPDNQQFARDLSLEVSQERHDLGPADGAGKQPEIELPPGDARDCRELVPVEVVLQHRGLSPRGPAAAAMGPFTQS